MTGALDRAVLAGLAALLVACESGGILGSRTEPPERPRIVIGSKAYTESVILAKLYGETLAAHGYEVEYRHTLAAPDLLTPASDASGIDLFPEYAGTGTADIAVATSPTADPDQPAARREAAARGHAALAPTPATHSDALAVTRATAEALGVASISDLVPHAGDLTFGGPGDCAERDTCLAGLTETYGLEFAAVEPIEALGLRYQALADGRIDVASVVTTDPQVAAHDLVVLDDDLGFYPEHHVVPLVRREYLAAAAADFERLVNAVSARITTAELATLNARVDIELRDPTDVALEWLSEQGLVQPSDE